MKGLSRSSLQLAAVSLALAGLATPAIVIAQSESAPRPPAKRWQPPRTPDGQPDISGTWVNFDSTPFEAPGAPQQAAGNPDINPPAHWTDHDSPTSTRRVSMVVDPADGKVPVMPWAEARRDYDLA